MHVYVTNDMTIKENQNLVLLLDKSFSNENITSLLEKFPQYKNLALKFDEFSEKNDEPYWFPTAEKSGLIIYPVNKLDDLDNEEYRNLSVKLLSLAKKMKLVSLAIYFNSNNNVIERVQSIIDGFQLGGYSFEKYKKTPATYQLENVNIIINNEINLDEINNQIREQTVINDNVILCRNLVNETSDKCNPETFASIASEMATELDIKCRILNSEDLKNEGLNLLYAVGRGGAYSPRMVILEYNGNDRAALPLALVGKGITFDAGGLNLKGSGHIETMRSDMAGAAAVLYTMKSIAELKAPVKLIAAIPLAENFPGSTSYRPGDIFTGYNGLSVEIGNTDAEGRLILADAVSYIEKNYQPEAIIDVATLTGAALIALGEECAGLVSTSDKLCEKIISASQKTGEALWRLPYIKSYKDEIKSDFADMTNVSASRNAGTIIGGIFIKNFIEKDEWAHLDIAGTSWYSKARGYRPKYATGYGVRLLSRLVIDNHK